MSNSIALTLALLILAGIGGDVFWWQGENLLFLARKLAELIEWLAFWR